MDAATRLNAHVSGPADARPVVLVHGFGCDQAMWRLVAPELAVDHRVVPVSYTHLTLPTILRV